MLEQIETKPKAERHGKRRVQLTEAYVAGLKRKAKPATKQLL
jgi:hypothetical protein